MILVLVLGYLYVLWLFKGVNGYLYVSLTLKVNSVQVEKGSNMSLWKH